jgi:hypothetical protein|nr:MAG: hypothetical protein DIU54_05345 [Acidobacteriota bacterium]
MRRRCRSAAWTLLIAAAALTAHPGAQDAFVLPAGEGLEWRPLGGPLPTSIERVTFLTIDTAFPPNLCAGSPSVTVCTRLWLEPFDAPGWLELPPLLAAPVVADPRDPDILFGGDLVRYDRRTTQAVDVRPDGVPGGRTDRIVPKVFSPDGRTLFAATTAVYRTTNGGDDWTMISPDWSTLDARVATLSVSPVDSRLLWVGLSNGAIRVTRNAGTTWHDAQTPWRDAGGRFRVLDGSHFDPNGAYALVDVAGTTRFYRTRDGGDTWVDLTDRLAAAGTTINAVREDRFRRGLLFAATDRTVTVSFDDGETWQEFSAKLPDGPVHAIAIHEARLAAATTAGIWTLDDISALRQLTADVARADFFLFRPATAWRPRASAVPGGPVAPGATFTYLLGEHGAEDVALEVVDPATGDLIRRWSSQPDAGDNRQDTGASPLPTTPGLHRVDWDLRYTPPVAGDDVPAAAVLPGFYQVRLAVDGRVMRQAVSVRMDPRVRTSLLDLTALRDLGRSVDTARAAVDSAMAAVDASTTADTSSNPSGDRLAALADELRSLAAALQRADARPGTRLQQAIEDVLARTAAALGTSAGQR